jgi:uncharacterized membrane protein YhhN
MFKRWVLILFFISAVLEITAQILNSPGLHWVAKPLLLILLTAYYQQSTPSINRVFFLALIFCWLGDVLLMFEQYNEFYFMTGLGSFLMAHMFLIFSYRQLSSVQDAFEGTQRVRLSFPIILAGSGLTVILYSRLGDLRIPVLVYALVLTLMVVQAIFRLGRTNANSFWLVFFGAVFFMLSDSLLAINKFYQPISLAGLWVMITYIAAIYLIVSGVLAHDEKASKVH